MKPTIPESVLRYGFATSAIGVHTGKTILFPELSLLMEAAPDAVSHEDYRRSAVDENAVLKATSANRVAVFGALKRLYGLSDDLLVFRSFRTLWADSAMDRPLLALLLAATRDSALRESASVVLQKRQGEAITASDFEVVLADIYGNRYSPKTRRSMAEHLGGSWVQSGHLSGRSIKRRARTSSGPESVAYALFLGYLCGARGMMLYDSLWCQLLDLSKEQIDAQAFAAAQRGWLTYRRIGDVAEINFPKLLTGVKDEES